MNPVTEFAVILAAVKKHMDDLRGTVLFASAERKTLLGEELTAAEDRVCNSVRAAEVEYSEYLDKLHRMELVRPVIAPAPAAASVEPDPEIVVCDSALRCTVDSRDVQETLRVLEHVVQGPEGFIAPDGKAHVAATRAARILEEIALPIFHALTQLESVLEGPVFEWSATHPELVAEIHGDLMGVVTTLMKGVTVAKRQSMDVSLSVHVSLAALDAFRGTLTSSATKEEVKFLKKFREAAAKAKE